MNSLKKVEKKYSCKVECAECGSKKTILNSLAGTMAGLSVSSLIVASICMWIPVVGWFLLPFALLMFAGFMVATPIAGAMSKTYSITCQDCKSKFTIDKKEYKEMKKRS